MFYKAVSAITLLLGAIVSGIGVYVYFASYMAAEGMSAIQATQLATEACLTMVCGMVLILFGFAVGGIAVLREIRNALVEVEGTLDMDDGLEAVNDRGHR